MTSSVLRSAETGRSGPLWWLPRGGRGNGLDDDGWAPILEISEAAVPAVLIELQVASVPAYAAPAGLAGRSFASTNEQEGSEIARQIIRALLDSGIRVFFVTHLFDLAHSLYTGQRDSALFLRPERRVGGQRTFRLLPGEPLSTSYGPDLYRRISGAPEPAASSSQAGAGGSACGPQIT